MQSVADYEAWKAKQQQVRAKASAFVVGQSEGNPDQLAGDLQLATDFAAATGNPKPPAPMVGEYRSVFQAAIEKTRAETILSSSPRLTDWLRDPENATLAKDDLETLSWWESAAIVPRGIASAAPAFNEGFYNLAGTIAALPGDNSVSQEMFRLANVSRGIKETTAGPSGNWLGRQVQGASQSIGMMAPGIAASVLSGGTATPAVMAAYMLPGAVTQGGQGARQGMDAGLSPERALLYGGTNAAAEVLFERIPVGRLLGDIAQGSGFGKILAGQLATELPTEVGTTLFQNLNEWVTLNPEKTVSDFIAEQPEDIRDTVAQTFLATLGLSGIGAGVTRLSRMQEEQAKAQDAEGRVTLFQELSGQAVASKLRARMPERFRQFVERATANGPVESVYVPASEFARYFQDAGIDPYALVDEMDGVSRDDLDAALAGGGDLKIPTATYAAKIAGSDHDAFLMENMRFDPLDMTAREAAEFNARADEIMQEMWAEAEDIRQDDERWRAVEEQIHDQVVSQMRAAGLSTERAMAEVQPVVAFYRTRAARMGLTTEEYLAKNPLPGIQGSIPQGMQFKNVDELNRTLAEARNRRAPAKDARQSLLEFIDGYGGINDRGGELKARDAAAIKRPGKKTLRLARDDSGAGQASMFGTSGGKRFGVDDVAQAAIEAGFMADNPVVIAYKASLEDGTQAPDITAALWDAIDAELRGQKQASEQDAAPADERYLDEIEGYLNSLGLDLSNSDDEIRQAIERDQAAPDRMYGQDGQIATESDAFKEWFGASKVVDADGKPLVVYHGTASDFDAFSKSADPKHIELPGFFFTPDAEIANGFSESASRKPFRDDAGYIAGFENSNVMPVYLSIQNPAEINLPDRETGRMSRSSDVRAMLEQAQADGHDGAVIRGWSDGSGDVQWVAFTPTQIKSVNNRGTFDLNDPRILFQDGADTPLKRLLGGARERIAQRNSEADRIAEAGRPVVMSNGDLRALVGPNTVAGEKPFRVTYLGADGKPNGHVEAATLRDAAIRAMEDGFMPDRTYQQAQDGDQPLYVVHNLSAEKLRKANEIGGLAAPSLAVARGDIGFDDFGEISLIGAPSLADPKTKGVRLFNADVYSPRQPRARFKVDQKAARAMNAVLSPVAERLGLPFDDIRADEIEREGLSAIDGQIAAKAAWLESVGLEVPIVREQPDEPMPVNGMGMITGTDAAALVNDPAFLARVQRKYELAIKKNEGNPELIARINEAWLDEAGGFRAKMVQNWADQVARANQAIEAFRANPQGEGKISRWLTGQAIDDAIGNRIGEFNGWTREQFGGVITDMFFENDAGRKKEYTLANLVREMTRTIRNGENWNYGAGNVRAAVAPEFRSLAEVKAARGQITDKAAMDALKDEVNNELFALADKFAPFVGREGQGFGWGDTFSEFLRDVAKGPRAVAEWPWAGNIPPELMDEAVGFLEKLKGLPTYYFEIKMQRAMEFGEFAAALVPSNLAADARKILTDAGLELVEYQRGDDGAGRNAALQQIGPKVFFQDTQGPRGSIQFGADGQSLIRLFETANLSTLQHEMGHLFLTMMQRDVASGDPASLAEYEVIKTWWRGNAKAVAADGNRAMPDAKLTAEDVQRAIDLGTTGDMMKDAAIDVGMQEQWARGYEAYLMEGKSPSVELRSAFEKFRSWMISVYRSLVGLNVQISDDIRGVFDRMLATDEEIAKAKQSSGENRPIFTSAEQMGLTQEEFDRLMKLRVQSEDETKARLLREIMAPIKRQREAWWKEERAKTEEEVTRQVNALPVFRALEWLGNRRWLGGDAPDAMPDMRMSKDMLIDRYGEGVLKTLPRGMQTVYTVEGGLDPDEAAGWFGFDSGDALIRALERAPKRSDAIQAETDRVMNERHGDALNDGEIEAIALDAVHTDKRGEWLAAELKAVAEVAGVDVKLTMKDARASARQTVARMKVRDATAAMRFLAAERKAGEEAARLGAMLAREGVWMQNARRRIATKAKAALRDAGTVDAVAGQIDQANRSTGNYNETVQKLIDAKRRQLINHALFMEARGVAEEVAKAEGFVKRLNKASMREKIAGAGRREGAQVDYLGAIDEILDTYDFRKLSGRQEQRRGALVAFVDAMKAAGRENELAIPEAVLRSAQMKPYKALTVEELRGVIDSLKNLQHIAMRWNDLIDMQNQRKLEEVVNEITAAFDANLPKRPPGRLKTTGEALRNSARQFIDLVLNAGTILREIDGFQNLGPAYRNMKAPIDQAMDRLTLRKEKAAADMDDLYAVYSKDDRRKMSVRKAVPGIPFTMSRWEMIAVALNTGNEGNYQRLTDPNVRGSLTPDQVNVILNSLDARDADFVQSVWDFIGSFRDDIAARERRATGVEPAWVDPLPVDIGGKTLRGGYYPLKYDARLSTLARDDETQSMAEALQAGRFGKAQTKRGHLEARAKSSGRDIELDMSVLHRHVNQVIYDLELSEPVANSWKVLQSSPVRQAFMDAGRQADFDALEIWLKDVAEGQLNAGDLVNRNARRFKSNFTAAKLAFNLGTVAAQITGLSQSMVVVGKRDFVRGLQASFRPGIMDQITAKSVFMRQRQTTFNKDIADYYSDPSLGPTASRWGEIKRDWIGPASFWLMTKVQFILVDTPTWLGGYHQGLRMFDGDDAKAVEHADAIVKRAQSSGLFSDRSAVERGSVSRTARQNDVIRLFTTLGSYMFAKFNVAYERAAVGGRIIRQEGVSLRSAQEAASLTLDMAFLFTVEAVIMAAIKGGLPGEDDDEEGNGTGDEWAAFLAKETAFSVLGTIPFVRDIASAGKGFEGGGAYGGITSELVKPFVEMGQGQVDKGMVKSVVNVTGLFLGLPAAQMNRAIDAAWRELLEGEDVAPVEYLLGKRG